MAIDRNIDENTQMERTYALNEYAKQYYRTYLMSEEGKAALDYLSQRGLTAQTVEKFELGAAPDGPDGLIRHLKGMGFSLFEIAEAGLAASAQNGGFCDAFRNRVIFPIVSVTGKAVGFVGRIFSEEDKAPKYLGIHDTPVYRKSEQLYGLNLAKESCADQLILVEGPLDAILLHQAGIPNAAALLGTSFTDSHAKLVSGYTKEAVICYDADPAGRNSVSRTLDRLREARIPAKVLITDECKDPCEYILRYGGERFRALLKSAGGDA